MASVLFRDLIKARTILKEKYIHLAHFCVCFWLHGEINSERSEAFFKDFFKVYIIHTGLNNNCDAQYLTCIDLKTEKDKAIFII